MQTTKQIYFSKLEHGERRWAAHWAGRPGVTRTVVTRERYDHDGDGVAPGLYLDVPVALAEAWDAGVRAATAAKASGATIEEREALIAAALDAVAPRG